MLRRLSVFGCVLAFISVSTMALATTVPTTAPSDAETTTTAVIEPAVPVTEAPPSPAKVDWTYRYFIPTLLILAVLVVVGTVVQYFLRVVRKRYRVVR